MTTRREFLLSSAAMLAAAGTGRARVGRLPLGFSTLGCPQWDLERVLDFAASHGYASVELRGLQDQMDLTKHAEFAPARLADLKRRLAERGLRVSCLGSSAHMHEMDASKHAAQLDEGRRFIDLAQALDAPYVRVFGDRYVEGVPKEEMRAKVARGLRELGDYARERGVTVVMESHGQFTDSPALREILERADSPAVALLWDAHHTFVSGKEEPEHTVRQLGRWIR
ncbi:MAG TPA: sugar phosphate isomerase/epimerase family protein, partial [Myxococcaceae bacterium]|nr:sugar phosphate isomerase/epimerase family protein [Myxococcaceae bacterium]